MAASVVLLSRSGTTADDFDRFPSGSEIRGKRARKKSVSWPCNENLCEVRQFWAEDTPSLIRLNWQGSKVNSTEVPLVKRARLEAMNKDALPGSIYLVARQPDIDQKMDTFMRPEIQWHHPQKFALEDLWLVARGDESTEVSVESRREIRVFEAFYPRYASIPNSPAEPHEGCLDLKHTHVPLVPLEEVEVANEEAVLEDTHAAEVSGNLNTSQDSEVHRDIIGSKADLKIGEQADLSGTADPNITAVAAAACMAVKALGESDLVDQALLVELLRNPSLLKSLTSIDRTPMYNGKDRLSSSKSSTPDLSAYSNSSSPVSVLTIWGEDNAKQSSRSSTPSSETTGISTEKHPRDASPTTSTATVGPIASGNAPNDLLSSSRSPFQQEQAHSDFRASSLDQDGRCRTQARMLPYQRSQPAIPNLHLMQAVTAPMHSHPVSNNEASLRATRRGDKLTICRRVGEDNTTSRLQRKCAILGDPLKAGARNNRLCIYFNTPKGCRKGGSCAFLHQSTTPLLSDPLYSARHCSSSW